MKVIVLKKNQDILNHEINIQSPKLKLDDLKNIDIDTGSDTFSLLYIWKLGDCNISIYGWKDGVHNQVNQTELPPPLDTPLCFGDLVLTKSINNKNVDFEETDYLEFYDKIFGGFEDLGSEDSSSDEEEDDDNISNDSFIVNDSDMSDQDESYVPSDDELEESSNKND